IVVVGKAGVLGVRRLLTCLDEARRKELPRIHVVVTRVRRSRKTGDDRAEIARILAMKGYENVHWITEDTKTYEEAENRGMLLREVNHLAGPVKDIAGLAAAIASRPIATECEAENRHDNMVVRARFAPAYA
ncbi:MAG: hypothetical protein IKZ87_02875, partial [Actinomycetaceae bacterium]|nr:hypothetical protein [Actinomycetaceae bacterium]